MSWTWLSPTLTSLTDGLANADKATRLPLASYRTVAVCARPTPSQRRPDHSPRLNTSDTNYLTREPQLVPKITLTH